MRIFSDWHHSGLGRSLYLLFKGRLGHDIYFPNGKFAEIANERHVGMWLTPNIREFGGVPDALLDDSGEIPTVIGPEEFQSTEWDAVLITRSESQDFFRELIAKHPSGSKIKIIGQAGNDGTNYDWDFVRNFLSSDYLSFLRCPPRVNSIHYMQEIGEQFRPKEYTPITEQSLRTVNTYINCLNSFLNSPIGYDRSLWGGKCPHCDCEGVGTFDVSVFGIWEGMKEVLNNHSFRDYGINNTCGFCSEKAMPDVINGSSLTWGFKTYEGFGHSIAQSVSMGRLVVVPRRFHKYRTASQFLIPNLTCLEADWSAVNCAQVISAHTKDLDSANEFGQACFDAAKGLFNWQHEANRVKKFLDNIQ